MPGTPGSIPGLMGDGMGFSSSAPDLGFLLSGRRSASVRAHARKRLPFLSESSAMWSTSSNGSLHDTSGTLSASFSSFPSQKAKKSVGVPNGMLNGLSSFAEEENERVERDLSNMVTLRRQDHRRMSWKTIQTTVFMMSKLGHSKPGEKALNAFSDEEAMAQEMDSVAASITQLRRKHETFQPISPNAAARQQLFGAPSDKEDESPRSPGRSSASPRGVDRLSPEERRERFELLKYVRKIEPDLPPLERLPMTPTEPPNQALVNFNASSEAIQRWRPDVRSKLLQESLAQYTQHVKGVVRNGHAVKAAACARKRELGEQRANGSRGAVLGDVQMDLAGQWLVLCAVGSFTQSLVMDLRLRRVQDRDDYVTKHWDRLRRRKLPMRTLTQSLINLISMTRNEHFMKRAPLVGTFFSAKMVVRRRRVQARMITGCLRAWKAAGPVFLQLKRIGSQIRKLQQWWRERAVHLRRILGVVTQKWLACEREILLRDVLEAISWAAHESHHELEARIDRIRIPKDQRIKFLQHELRARRYFLLPRIYIWEEDTRRWQEEMREWAATREARMVVSNGERVELPAFHWAPGQPSYIPSDADVHNMLRRAMTNSEGWTEIRHSRQVALGKRKAVRGSSATSQRSQRDVLSVHFDKRLQLDTSLDGEEDDAYLRRLGISETHMPGGVARPLPPTTECED